MGYLPNPDQLKAASGERAHAERHRLGSAVRGVILPFWTSRAAIPSYVAAVVILAMLVGELQIAILNNSVFGDLSGALVDRRTEALGTALKLVGLLALLGTLNIVLFGFLRRFVMIEWRRWLVARYQADWLARENFYRIERDGTLDNPDQRISQDSFVLVDSTTRVVTSLIRDLFRTVGFAVLLLSLGATVDLHGLGIPATVPGGLLIGAVLLAILSSAIAFYLGHPLVGLRVEQQRRDADLRFTLANVRANAEQIALYRGEGPERSRVSKLLGRIAANWHHIMRSQVRLVAFNSVYQQTLMVLAAVAGLQHYLGGRIDYAHLTMVGNAFLMVMNGLSALIILAVSGDYYEWASAVRRLDAFDVELSRREAGGIEARETPGEALLEARGLRLDRPDGEVMAAPGDLAFHAGERWMVRGPSGAGKSTLMRAAAGLWPHGEGEVRFAPEVRQRTLFLPQKSYVPAGPLIDALAYPGDPGSFTHDEVADALRMVRLDRLVAALDEDAVWQQRLSPGEQQRLAFTRVFLHQPDVLLLDEATSALDADNERHLYRLLTERLPHALVISIAHRESLSQFHDRQLDLGAPA